MDTQIRLDVIGNFRNVEDDQNCSGRDQRIYKEPGNAIIVRKAQKRYSKKQPVVLNDLNMTVRRGSIYALLGASGCGKTTLLSCIVGVRKLDHGDIWVLGGKPGKDKSGVPGPRVGYMPQETALVDEFTTLRAFHYFGKINGLDDDVIDERFEYFSKLLDLPPKDRFVKNMSGGQQRRVSLAVSLLHKPELLILDEPTVGLDPILREGIWNFLVKLAKEEGTAIVITTHYIDEAKQADRIGLMRSGKLLAETTPQKLIAKFQCSTLEEVFVTLSQRQEDDQTQKTTEVDNSLDNDLYDDISTIPEDDPGDVRTVKKRHTGKIFRALMIKNLLQFVIHPGGIPFAILAPLIQIVAFFSAVGDDPKGLVMAVTNDEAGNCDNGKYLGKVFFNHSEGTCDYKDLSCRFLNGFNESLMTKRFYDTIEEATMAVEHGDAWGAMHFPRNFSYAMQSRRDDPIYTSTEVLEAGEISTILDMSDRQIGLFLQKGLYDRFFEISADISQECNYSRKISLIPIHYEEPIFGKTDDKYSHYVGPACMLTVSFLLAAAVSAFIIITDKSEGIWNRIIVQGVTSPMIFFCHLITQSIVITLQGLVLLLSAIYIFDLPCRGSFVLAIALLLMSGIAGMCFGLLISVVCNDISTASFAAVGSSYPIFLLSGTLWPVEGMPTIIRWCSLILPMAIPCNSLRSVLAKGFSIDEFEVYSGFLVLIGWIIILIALCLLGVRSKST